MSLRVRRLVDSLQEKFVKSARVSPWITGLVVFTSGILFWGAFNWSLEASNTESFCISCHEMREYIYPDYRKSSHYANDSGVRATCPDCHVPRNWINKIVRKVGATNELYHKLIGSINTRGKFIDKRMELAGFVWDAMAANDSLECRNCHELTFMDKDQINIIPAHLRAKEKDLTCIDCHMGIAHELPEAYFDVVHARYEEEDAVCENCHTELDHTGWGAWE